MRLISKLVLIVFAILATSQIAAASDRILRINAIAYAEIDPAKGNDNAAAMLLSNIYDFLVRPTPDGNLAPDLAESWKVSPDGTEYTFKLKPDLKFHSGDSVSANDVVFSARRILAMKQGYAYMFEKIDRVEAVDPHDVKFVLKEPFAPFLASLVRLGIIDSKLAMANKNEGSFGDLGDYGQAYLREHDAGSGAYLVESHNGQEQTVLRRFNGYHGGFAVNAPDIVRIRYNMEGATIRTLMSRGEHDIATTGLSTEQLTALIDEKGIKPGTDRMAGNLFLAFNTRKPPTDDVHFRRAMALAMDYDTLLKLTDVAGTPQGEPARGPLPRGLLGYDPLAAAPHRDLERARAEMKQAKYKPGEHPVEITWIPEVPLEERFCLLFQQNMADLGVKVNITRVPWALLTQMASKPETTPIVSTIYVIANSPDPDSILWPMYRSTAAGTWTSMSWLSDAVVDQMLEKGRRTADPKARQVIYRDLVMRLKELQPAIFGYDRTVRVAIRSNISAPSLEDPHKAVAVTGGNYLFRTFQIN